MQSNGAERPGDHPIVRFGGQRVTYFAVVEEGHHRRFRCYPGQRPVIRAAAAAQPYPGPVHGQRGYQYKIHSGDGVEPEQSAGRLPQADDAGW